MRISRSSRFNLPGLRDPCGRTAGRRFKDPSARFSLSEYYGILSDIWNLRQ
eukprot:XP_001707225.1 Hypothetical protein GL50803_118904 [Giardia lamblia ATCC 50803]